jgi:hypothetical protein
VNAEQAPKGLTWKAVAREVAVDENKAERKAISLMHQRRPNQREKEDHAEDNPALSKVIALISRIKCSVNGQLRLNPTFP